jgi:hypothetical protein
MVFEFRDWIKTKLVDPLAGPIAKVFDKLPVEEQIERVKEAEKITKQLNCFSMSSALAKEHLSYEEGIAKFGEIWLRQHHPDIDSKTAFLVMQEVMPELAKAFPGDNGATLGAAAESFANERGVARRGAPGLGTDLSNLAVGGERSQDLGTAPSHGG